MLAFLSFGLKAQTDLLDSLKNELAQYENRDSVQLKLLINISNNVVWSDPEEAMQYADRAIDLAQELGWQRGIAYALRQKGVVYYHQSDFLNAMDVFLKCLEENEALQDKSFESGIYNNLANIYSEVQQFDKAVEYYQKLLDIGIELNDENSQIIALVNRGLVYTDIEKHDLAIKDLNNGLELAVKVENTYFQAAILNNLGRAYHEANMVDSAVRKYEQTVELSERIGNKNAQSSAMNQLAQIYLDQGKEEDAMSLAREALQYAQEVQSMERAREAWKTLSNAAEKLEDYKTAHTAFQQYIALRDSILGEENKAEITRKELSYQMALKETQDAAEIERQSNQKNLAIIGIVAILIITGVGYILYKRRRDALELKKEADFQRHVAETELRVLKSQLNPHFIFNSLNAISNFVDQHEVEQANDYLIKFSKLMRLTVELLDKETVSLSQDLDWIRLYLTLESMRMGNQFNYSIEVDQTIDLEEVFVPPMIVQPFIENSLWHGIAGHNNEGNLTITVQINEDQLIYTVEDDGVGMKASANKNKNTKEQSYGIKITQSRINILNQLKDAKADVALIDKPKGLKVEVSLPADLQY